MPYLPPWMPGGEALAHIRRLERCSESEAIAQLRAAIFNRAVRAGPANMGRPLIHSETIPPPQIWQQAEIFWDGTVRFDPEQQPYPFEVLREDVLREWPEGEIGKPNVDSNWPPNRTLRNRSRPVETRVRRAIEEEWPDGIPQDLKAKERDQKIAVKLQAAGHKVPLPNTLARAVQRAVKAKRSCQRDK